MIRKGYSQTFPSLVAFQRAVPVFWRQHGRGANVIGSPLPDGGVSAEFEYWEVSE